MHRVLLVGPLGRTKGAVVQSGRACAIQSLRKKKAAQSRSPSEREKEMRLVLEGGLPLAPSPGERKLVLVQFAGSLHRAFLCDMLRASSIFFKGIALDSFAWLAPS